GDATLVSPGQSSQTAAQLRSTAGGMVFGGIDFAIPAGTTLNDYQNLSTDYMFTASSCGGRSPRFVIDIDGSTINVYLGPPPSYTGCPPNLWSNTGDLLTPTSFVDTSNLAGGTFYDPWALALARYGTHAVTGVQLITDSSSFFGGATQTVLVDNVMINSTTFTFEPKNEGNQGNQGKFGQCKHGGWRNITSAPAAVAVATHEIARGLQDRLERPVVQVAHFRPRPHAGEEEDLVLVLVADPRERALIEERGRDVALGLGAHAADPLGEVEAVG